MELWPTAFLGWDGYSRQPARRKKCGPGQPPGPHSLREISLPATVCIRARGRFPEAAGNQRFRKRLCVGAAPAHPRCAHSYRALPVAVPPCETVSEEAATPRVARNACTFREPLRRLILSILLRGTPLGRHPQPTLRKTAAEPALRDHWQRVIHACSDCTFSRWRSFINSKVRRSCAKPVEDGTSLWMVAEKGEVIGSNPGGPAPPSAGARMSTEAGPAPRAGEGRPSVELYCYAPKLALCPPGKTNDHADANEGLWI